MRNSNPPKPNQLLTLTLGDLPTSFMKDWLYQCFTSQLASTHNVSITQIQKSISPEQFVQTAELNNNMQLLHAFLNEPGLTPGLHKNISRIPLARALSNHSPDLIHYMNDTLELSNK